MAYTYECPLCDWVGKTKGSLTQHANREHGGGGSLTELMGKYGEFAPKPGGAWRPNRPLSAAPSGVPSVDYAIGIGGLPRGTIVEIYGPAGCLSGDMVIDTNVTGTSENPGRSRKVKLEDLFRRVNGCTPVPVKQGECGCGCGGQPKPGKHYIQHHASRMQKITGIVRVRSLVNGEIRLQTVRGVTYSGIRETVLVRFASGKELRCTPDHRVLTPNGWVEAQGLNQDDEVVCNGRVIDSRGYPALLGPEWESHPRASILRVVGVAEHIIIAEAKLERPLRDDEVVHHIDGNPMNNDPANLAVISRSEHNSVHKLRYNFHNAIHPHNGAHMVVLPDIDTVISVEPMGWCQTFDIQMDSEPNFVANGVVVHNSGKTLTALTFSAFSQQHGGLAGYADAEHRLQPTFAKLVPGLNLDDLHYSEPDGGEQAMNMTKDFVGLGIYDIWTVDSVHACVPKALREKDIGDATMAELAKLMSVSMQVLEPIVSSTNTVVIMVNHVKAVPGVQYGKDWAKPGGSAMDYYPSVQLKVHPVAIFTDDEGRKIGHTVKVKVENSKVAAPFASATYDIFYKEGTIKKKEHERNGDKVVPGIDIASCWFSVGEETGTIVKNTQGKWITIPDAEILGTKREVIEMLKGDCDLKNQLHQMVYGQYARTKDGSILELPKSVVRGELEAEPMNVTEPEMSLEEALKMVS